jgi:phosphoribosyl 1,2-cyclic phosphodiesterase
VTRIEGAIDITFFGVRGSTPCHGPEVSRYGGNTSCVSVDVPGHDPIMFDLGTGARYYGIDCQRRPKAEVFRGSCFVSHLHWDHVQGLPFFPPLLQFGNELDIYAPKPEEHESVRAVVDTMLCPPLFPVGVADLPGEIRFHDLLDDEVQIGEITVTARLIPHIGRTLGYRLEWNGISVAYLSDHQQPGVDLYEMAPGVEELCDGVDLLIHDAQYTRDEFTRRSGWGHCTIDYAVWVGKATGARTVALFHHDPMHDDEILDTVAKVCSRHCEPKVVVAREGLKLHLAR